MMEDEELARVFPSVSLVLGNGRDMGAGALFITTRRVIWLSAADSGLGCGVAFTHINLHAISTDTALFPRACIYMQLEAHHGDGASTGEAEEDDEDTAPEVRLAPSDANSLEEIFKALCECATLNPDPGMEEDSEDGEFFYDEEEVAAGAGGADRVARLNALDALLTMPRADQLDELLEDDPRFEDAEEDENGEASDGSHPPTPQ
ncbi:hypothetical protein WJX81_003862 [Elliptochloris bilobata]|uniref:Chloride conductance regulatory protein ICln n=1 Tax=Elliptochloris bilobata TaxID=381761 RepID=A0AAW1QLC2_9CHLO